MDKIEGIQKIKEVEEDVANSIKQAEEDANAIFRDVINRKDAVVKKRKAEVEEEMNAKREEELKRAKEKSCEIIKKAESEVERIRSVDIDKAVDVVVEGFGG